MAKESEADKLAAWYSAQDFTTQKEVLERLQGLHGDAVEAKRRELMTQLAELGGPVVQPKKRGVAKGGTLTAMYRGPNGEEYSGRGQIPRWARDLGITDKAGLEKYRIKS